MQNTSVSQSGAAPIRIGCSGWNYKHWRERFYPKGLPARRWFEFYAEHFDTVEANSTYYRLPDESMVANWAERVPESFVMHVKAFGMMTRHPVKADVLPPDLQEAAPVNDRGRIDRPPRLGSSRVQRRSDLDGDTRRRVRIRRRCRRTRPLRPRIHAHPRKRGGRFLVDHQ